MRSLFVTDLTLAVERAIFAALLLAELDAAQPVRVTRRSATATWIELPFKAKLAANFPFTVSSMNVLDTIPCDELATATPPTVEIAAANIKHRVQVFMASSPVKMQLGN
jgi:hypothetical protein